MRGFVGVLAGSLVFVSIQAGPRGTVELSENIGEDPTSAPVAQVQVVNFPVDASGDLKVKPTRTQFLDLLDTVVTLDPDLQPYWESDPFDVDRFTSAGLRPDGTSVYCSFAWAWFDGDSYVGPSTEVAQGGVDWSAILGVQARVKCRLAGSAGTITDVKVLLRRE